MYQIIIGYVPDLSKHVLLGDLSTKSSATQSSAVGDCAPDKETKVGKHVRALVLNLDLAIPSTLADYFAGSCHHNYIHHSG